MFNKNYSIQKITAREILDSRSHPTIEAIVTLNCGLKAKASVPSGASTGKNEALEMRDKDKKRFNGLGVLKSCQSINQKISPLLAKVDINEQRKIDDLMISLDGTPHKSKLGANTILSVSLATARAGAMANNLELYQYLEKIYDFSNEKSWPVPMFNIINGGRHADSGLDVQEFMIIPKGIKKFPEQIQAGSKIFIALKEILKKNSYTVSVGDEGGYAPHLKNSAQALDYLILAIKKAGYQPGKQIFIGLDIGSSEFYQSKNKQYFFEHKKLSAPEMIKIYQNWLKKYPLISLEDPLAENDFKNWQLLNSQIHNSKFIIHNSLLIVGDDLFTTNTARLKIGIEKNVANAVIVKPNQIGTLTETISFIKLAQSQKYKIIISHRSGETNDDFIADLAIAAKADFVKFGAPNRGERVAKYNRLLEIENKIRN